MTQELLRRLDTLNYYLRTFEHPPNIRNFFQKEEIELLLSYSITRSYNCDERFSGLTITNILIRAGYKDEPDVYEDGMPSPRRTTPIHRALLTDSNYHTVSDLFKIYDRFDVNYTDESGLTHFHMACKFNCYEAVKKFLEFGHDPNLLVPETGDSPLHLAIQYCKKYDVVKLLLRCGANPNLANNDGSTPLHYFYQHGYNVYNDTLIKMFFEICDEKQQSVQVDAQDKFGNTPLHLALQFFYIKTKEMAELLLRRGANPNSTNAEGSTPLHIIARYRFDKDDLVNILFEISKEKHQLVQVDARDEKGRTPLQWAVAHFYPNVVGTLLDHGADISSFVFPDESYFACSQFGKKFGLWARDSLHRNLTHTCNLLAVVEHLEKRGYELYRSDALMIMKELSDHRLFEISSDLFEHRFDDEEFEKAKNIMMRPDLSLYDLIKLRPETGGKIVTHSNYLEFGCSEKLDRLSIRIKEACLVHIFEKLWRRVFLSWALEPFIELTHCRLPIHCCEMIIEPLKNEDLYNICLAAEIQRS
uniref:Uncharacterized protein n=1 Tax=Trichogramma kaykai TaxID=54128 RepID=A0ABD2XF84_9HYME